MPSPDRCARSSIGSHRLDCSRASPALPVTRRTPQDPLRRTGGFQQLRALRRLGPYAALDLRVVIDCHDSHAVADEIERALGSLAAAALDTPPTGEVTMTVWSDGDDGWNLDAGRQSTERPGRVRRVRLRAVADHPPGHRAFPRYLVVHASAVARDGVAVIFPAEADSGKSTLATILVEAGFDYLTDEATRNRSRHRRGRRRSRSRSRSTRAASGCSHTSTPAGSPAARRGGESLPPTSDPARSSNERP